MPSAKGKEGRLEMAGKEKCICVEDRAQAHAEDEPIGEVFISPETDGLSAQEEE